MESVIEFANKGGYVFGVCNGFQILCEAGLVPGALLHNVHHKFNCKNVYIKAENSNSLITSLIEPGKALKIPVAHGEGRYYADAETIKSMTANGQILFRYCDAKGEETGDYNPNGAIENIAGVCNAGKNVFGMMPHPERAADSEVGNTDGKILFESILPAVTA
jgi:phosphoribosylformylglycinamidine synthase subunit PurQ / glutaminase